MAEAAKPSTHVAFLVNVTEEKDGYSVHQVPLEKPPQVRPSQRIVPFDWIKGPVKAGGFIDQGEIRFPTNETLSVAVCILGTKLGHFDTRVLPLNIKVDLDFVKGNIGFVVKDLAAEQIKQLWINVQLEFFGGAKFETDEIIAKWEHGGQLIED